jgi:hypothetical protein
MSIDNWGFVKMNIKASLMAPMSPPNSVGMFVVFARKAIGATPTLGQFIVV